MAIYAMIAASAEDTGLVTPAYHIASPVTKDSNMMKSMKADQMTGAMYGAVFGAVASELRLGLAAHAGVGMVCGFPRLRDERPHRAAAGGRELRQPRPDREHGRAGGLGQLHHRAARPGRGRSALIPPPTAGRVVTPGHPSRQPDRHLREG